MELSPVKREILETVFLHDKPVKATQIAKELGKEFPSVMMHLIGLTRMGYTQSPEKGYYLITEEGKKALGIPQIDKENAQAILAPVSRDEMFHFYLGIGEPINLHAQGLLDFCEKIATANVNSVEFHVNRGDFETWLMGIGDAELAKKAQLLKHKKLSGEELRNRLTDLTKSRCAELDKIAK
jgi:DNA-binding transcriptional ArsR family regulator